MHALSFTDFQTVANARATASLATAASEPSVLANIFSQTHPQANNACPRGNRHLGVVLAAIECAPIPELEEYARASQERTQRIEECRAEIVQIEDCRQTLWNASEGAAGLAVPGGLLTAGQILAWWPVGKVVLKLSDWNLLSDTMTRFALGLRRKLVVWSSFGSAIAAGVMLETWRRHESLANDLGEAQGRKVELLDKQCRTKSFLDLFDDRIDPQVVLENGYWSGDEVVQYARLHYLAQTYPELVNPINDNTQIALNMLLDWSQYQSVRRDRPQRGSAFADFARWCHRNNSRRYFLSSDKNILKQFHYSRSWVRSFQPDNSYLVAEAQQDAAFDPTIRAHTEWLVQQLSGTTLTTNES